MKKRFYAWLWKKLYMRAVENEQKVHKRSGRTNWDKVNDYIKLQNMLNHLKEELIAGEVK